jgi:hypothetical protein
MRYAGIGSRLTPAPVFQAMRDLARVLANRGYALRSGAAEGADTAFELGAVDAYGEMEIYLPWPGFNGRTHQSVPISKAALALAQTVHPNWLELSQAGQKLHARNMYQVLGPNLDEPVKFVICWTADGCSSEKTRNHRTGGTATAIVLADRHGIPVYNLANPAAADQLRDHLDGTQYQEASQLTLF